MIKVAASKERVKYSKMINLGPSNLGSQNRWVRFRDLKKKKI